MLADAAMLLLLFFIYKQSIDYSVCVCVCFVRVCRKSIFDLYLFSSWCLRALCIFYDQKATDETHTHQTVGARKSFFCLFFFEFQLFIYVPTWHTMPHRNFRIVFFWFFLSHFNEHRTPPFCIRVDTMLYQVHLTVQVHFF